MTKKGTRVLEEALLLPAEERAEIADELLATLNDYEAEIEAAWAVEIERRVADARANPHEGVDWREALRNVEREVLGR
jgi:putative addiction module component (TIGR02574 family)